MPERICPNGHMIPDSDEFCHLCGRLPMGESPDEWNAKHPDKQIPAGQSAASSVEIPVITGATAWFKRHPSVLAFLLFILLLGGMANFTAFVQDSKRLGGDALQGYEQHGHYYVSGHGATVEVSKADWEANRILAMTGLAGWAVAAVSMGYLAIRYGRQWHVFSAQYQPQWNVFSGQYRPPLYLPDEAPPMGVEEVKATGPVLASVRGMSGKLGRYAVPLGELSVEVYPGGLVVSTVSLSPVALGPTTIAWVTYKRKGPEQGVKITHSSREIVSPIFIGDVREDSPFGQALNKVVGSAKVV